MAKASTGRGVDKRTVVKGALRVVRLDDLSVDPSYQRDVKAKHVRIVADFNEEALGVPLVGERGDGTKWIVDGLQRITALRKLGRRDVRAEVFASRGAEHEAQVFKLVNMNRTKLNPFEEFRALLTAHDEQAWLIKEAVEREGFRIVPSKATGRNPEHGASGLSCINTLRNATARFGIESVTFALRTVKAAWSGDPLAVYNVMVGGLCVFFHRHDGAVDDERLIPRLQMSTPQKIMYTAQNMAIGNMKRDEQVADVVEKLYRRRYGARRPGS